MYLLVSFVKVGLDLLGEVSRDCQALSNCHRNGFLHAVGSCRLPGDRKG